MEYRPQEIEPKWRKYWQDHKTYEVKITSEKPKYYVLDMFPYPSGAGLHVGHPLGYIASDIIARYKRLKGFNVLHPMGYDAFGLPAEQYAIQTGVHPADSTKVNIDRYRQQLDNLGFSFDWSREVRTCNESYYKWTQWIFIQLYEHFYDKDLDQAMPISNLIKEFERAGNTKINTVNSCEEIFSSADWKSKSTREKNDILMNYRLAYRKVGHVNWCEALGTVLANDEIKDGLSERGGHPVIQKPMLQWSLRTTAYAERLLNGLDQLEWSDALKAQQRNWIGRSEGAQIFWKLAGHEEVLEVYTTRPDTIFGVTFMVIAPEHDLVEKITTPEQKDAIASYLEYVQSRSERDRQSEVKKVTGAFTGAYVIHPFTEEKIPVYIGEYVLKDYGTGAIMAVPADDERDGAFAEKFNLPFVEVVDKSKYPGATLHDKIGVMINSDFVTGMEVLDAISAVNTKLESLKIGKRKLNFRLRDANYSRQRYWGEPFPISYDSEGNIIVAKELPVSLPSLTNFEPTKDGKSPLARITDWVNVSDTTRETDTMPGFAGSSWYFLRYMDANNKDALASKEALDYWQDVDLYVGGAEHAVGHLLYSRMWHKFLYDIGVVPTEEPFKKLVNQGMIQGRSNFIYRANEKYAEIFFFEKMKDAGFEIEKNYIINDITVDFKLKNNNVVIELKDMENLKLFAKNQADIVGAEGYTLFAISTQEVMANASTFEKIIGKLHKAISGNMYIGLDESFLDYPLFVSEDMVKDHSTVSEFHVDVNIVNNDQLDIDAFRKWRPEFKNAQFILNKDGKYTCGHMVEKMSKSKFNVVNPDDLVEKYGADTLRLFEMFLGPIEQSKPWDTQAIGGVNRFLFKLWSLFHNENGELNISDDEENKNDLKILHTCIKKVTDDIERFSLNTCVSAFMVCVNDLKKLNCNKRTILRELLILVCPYTPHISEELWYRMGYESSIFDSTFPVFDEQYLEEDTIEYPVSINGKKRGEVMLDANLSKEAIESLVPDLEIVKKWTIDDNKAIVKIIVVPKRMINVVVG